MNEPMDVRYPIGKYKPQDYSTQQKKAWLNEIAILPASLERALLNLDAVHLETPYREGGWTIKQVVHHLADSHMNAFIRIKLALTEDNPTIKTYEEKKWAELADSVHTAVNVSVTLLHALHIRFAEMLKSLDDQQWQRTLFHPQLKKEISIWYLLGMYAWHGKHHVSHIENTKFAI